MPLRLPAPEPFARTGTVSRGEVWLAETSRHDLALVLVLALTLARQELAFAIAVQATRQMQTLIAALMDSAYLRCAPADSYTLRLQPVRRQLTVLALKLRLVLLLLQPQP